MLDMDEETFRRHFRLIRQQYEVLNGKLTEMGGELNTELGGPTRIPQNIKTFSFLWYMANQNCFRELGEKCQVAQSTAHDVVTRVVIMLLPGLIIHDGWLYHDRKFIGIRQDTKEMVNVLWLLLDMQCISIL